MPAAPATHPRPKIGVRLTLVGNGMRLMRRASMVGLAMPVTEAKKIAEMSLAVRPSGSRALLDGALAELDGGVDPGVVGLAEAHQRGIGLEGEDEEAMIDAAVGEEAADQARLFKLCAPPFGEGLGDLGLAVAVGRKGGPYGRDLHAVLLPLLSVVRVARFDEGSSARCRMREACCERSLPLACNDVTNFTC